MMQQVDTRNITTGAKLRRRSAQAWSEERNRDPKTVSKVMLHNNYKIIVTDNVLFCFTPSRVVSEDGRIFRAPISPWSKPGGGSCFHMTLYPANVVTTMTYSNTISLTRRCLILVSDRH